MLWIERIGASSLWLAAKGGDKVLRLRHALGLLAAAVLPFLAGCATFNDDLKGANATVPLAEVETPGFGPAASSYYVEFRARMAVYLSGHAYIVYGPQDESGKPLQENISGFFPKYHMLGFFGGMVAVPGTVDEIKLDRKQKPLVTYRKTLTADEYKKLVEFIAAAKKEKKVWNMFAANCNGFVGEAARVVGLKVPPVSFMPTPAYVLAIRELNPAPEREGTETLARESGD
jgi:hypothetical protein